MLVVMSQLYSDWVTGNSEGLPAKNEFGVFFFGIRLLHKLAHVINAQFLQYLNVQAMLLTQNWGRGGVNNNR